MNILEIKHLSLYFKRNNQEDFEAVKDVSFKVEQGEILGIVGESGSGKSVTALSILGLLPYPKAYHTKEYSIIFNQQELVGLDEKSFRQIRGNKISFIFQEPMSSLNPLHKIGAQIAESLKIHQNLSREQIKKRTLELLQLVKIPEPEQKINAYPFELSGGQRQRVMIAMAIANNPQILIADEPTTALDVTIQEQIIDLLLELKHKLNMSIIFISHNLCLVHKIADHIAVMYRGELLEYGPAKQVFEQPKSDYTKKLISSNLLLNLRHKNDSKILLEVQNIEVDFPRKKNIFGRIIADFKAVDKVSFSLRQGETLGIVGESGSGKTSLALAMVNLLKHKGNVKIISGNKTEILQKFSKDLQIVFQDPYNSLNPRMTIKQIIEEGLTVHFKKLNENEKLAQIKAILKEVNLDENIMDKYPHEFSGGQRQRIALARALILQPKIIILDEPTSALDVTVQAQIVELLKSLQKKYNISYIFISHDMNAVRAMSHQIMVMKDGKVIEQGSTKQIFEQPQQPYTQQLIQASLL